MTATGAPIDMVWDKGVLRPISPFWSRRAEKEFTEGEVYRVVDQPERSSKSHAHYFATVNTAWANLPEDIAQNYPSPEHLRRYALIRAGFCDSQSIPCGTNALALRFAAFLKPVDEFALVTVNGSVVTLFRAKSQSYRAMGREDFQKSKDAVLGVLADMIEVLPRALAQQVAE